MLNLQSGITLNCSTETHLQLPRDEGMSSEVEDYTVCWIEITVNEPCDMDAKQVVLFGTDLQYRLNGRWVTLRKRQD